MTSFDRAGPSVPPQPPRGPARLLSAAQLADLRSHRSAYPQATPGRLPRVDLISRVEAAGLRGRGGAAFPTATKLQAVASAPGRPIVVVNGAEGEPLSRKDVHLLEHVPHLVLDGAVQAARLVGADQVHLAADRSAARALRTVDDAIVQRRAAGEVLAASCHVRPTPSDYVAGEETALVEHLDGRPAIPTSSTVRPYRRGVERRPTLILNVETAAHLAQVLRWGPDWFRSLGTHAHPGTALVTVSGPVASPGVHEIALGTSLSDVAAAAGGLRARPQAVLVGGYFGAWLPASTHDVGLCEEQLRPLGAAVGCGAIAFLPAGACGLRQSAAVLGWMQGETAGQCGPCVHGLAALAGELGRLADGSGDEGSVARLHRWAGQIEGRGACRLPDGAVRFLRSVLAVFDEDVRRHQAGAPCPPGPLLLPVPVSGTLSA